MSKKLKKAWNKISSMISYYDNIGKVEDIGQTGKGFNVKYKFKIGDNYFEIVQTNEWRFESSILENSNKGVRLLEYENNDIYILIGKVDDDEYQVFIDTKDENTENIYLEKADLEYFGEGISGDVDVDVPNIREGLVDHLTLLNPMENWDTKLPKED